MKLAARMGRLNWRAMLAELSPEAFEEWMASDELDGTISGAERTAWTMAAVGAALLAAKGIDAQPADFVPGAERPDGSDDRPPQSAEEQQANCQLIAAIANAAR
jgi:hypothetical protein